MGFVLLRPRCCSRGALTVPLEPGKGQGLAGLGRGFKGGRSNRSSVFSQTLSLSAARRPGELSSVSRGCVSHRWCCSASAQPGRFHLAPVPLSGQAGSSWHLPVVLRAPLCASLSSQTMAGAAGVLPICSWAFPARLQGLAGRARWPGIPAHPSWQRRRGFALMQMSHVLLA